MMHLATARAETGAEARSVGGEPAVMNVADEWARISRGYWAENEEYRHACSAQKDRCNVSPPIAKAAQGQPRTLGCSRGGAKRQHGQGMRTRGTGYEAKGKQD